MHKGNIILVSLLAGGLAVAGVTAASPFGGCDRGYRSEQMGFGHHRFDPVQRMMRHIDVSDEQEAQIRAIVEEGRAEATEQRAALREARQALRDLATGSDYDADRVRELAEQQAQIRADMTVARVDTMHRVYQVLTPEQQAELADLRERRRAKWEARQDAPETE